MRTNQFIGNVITALMMLKKSTALQMECLYMAKHRMSSDTTAYALLSDAQSAADGNVKLIDNLIEGGVFGR